MAEEPAPSVSPETPPTGPVAELKRANPTVKLAAVVLAGILTLAVLFWAQGIRTTLEKQEAFRRGIDGLASALVIPVLETKSVVNENRSARLQGIIESVQRSGSYDVVVVTDPQGNVLATTDTSLKGQIVKDMADPKNVGHAKAVDGLVEATSQIANDGGVVLGVLKVRAKL